jgi:hypothetical protein
MMDWKEFLPIESLAPLMGGLLLWFGVNYLVLGPNVVAPRMAEKYYMPVCLREVTSAREARTSEIERMRQQIVASARASAEAAGAQAGQAMQNILGEMLGAYGPQGAQLGRRLGQQAMGQASIGIAVQQQMQQRVQAELGKLQQDLAAERAKQKHGTASAYCGCTVAEGISERLEVALFSATLRLYHPPAMAALARGQAPSDDCGPRPVL